MLQIPEAVPIRRAGTDSLAKAKPMIRFPETEAGEQQGDDHQPDGQWQEDDHRPAGQRRSGGGHVERPAAAHAFGQGTEDRSANRPGDQQQRGDGRRGLGLEAMHLRR
jgi:hypothetical protein